MKNLSNDLDKMIAAARLYCDRQERLSLSTLGRIILNDTYFFERVQRTRNCHIATIAKVMAWLAENKKNNGHKKSFTQSGSGNSPPPS